MRVSFVACLAPIALIAGCNSGTSVTNASPEEVTKAAAASGMAVTLKPGKWITTAETISVDIPGMPAGAVEKMKAMAPTPPEISYCLTPEEVNRPEGLFGDQGGQGKSDCKFNKFTMTGGKVDMEMTCGTMVMKSSGTYTAETTETDAEMTEGTGVHMKLKSKAHWAGACDGSESK